MRPGDTVWLPGHSPVSGGVGQAERQAAILEAVPLPPSRIALHFRVPSYTRRGHHFDMESLGYVVLATWRHDLSRKGPLKLPEPFKPDSIWITMKQVPESYQGLEIAYDEPPPSPSADALVFDGSIPNPPALSVRGTVLPELDGEAALADSDWLGLELVFGLGVDFAEFGFAGPIKPPIDAMSPLLGRDRRGGPSDHRLHDLRIRSDERLDGGVGVRFWYCTE
jgi:hypothetical protein